MARPSEARCPLKTSTGWSKALAIAFWICVWEAAAIIIGEELFLPSPLSTVSALLSSISGPDFWKAVATTLFRIMAGFILSVAAALVSAVAASRFRAFASLMDPLVRIIRATPVASITILLLVWISSRNLSIAISFLMVFPIIYTNVLKGIRKNKSHSLRLGTVAGFTYTLTFCSTFAIPFLMSIKWETFITAFKVMSVFLLVFGNILFLIYLRKR